MTAAFDKPDSSPKPDENTVCLDGELSAQDPLEESMVKIRLFLSKHPVRALLVVIFTVTVFVIGAGTSGIIQDLVATWFRQQATPFLLRRTAITWAGLVLLLASGGACFVFLLSLAVRNFRLATRLGQQVAGFETTLADRDREIDQLRGVLGNQGRILDRHQRDHDSQSRRTDRLVTAFEKERQVLSILEDAAVYMTRSVLDGRESPDRAMQRFFSAYKRTIPHFFRRPEDIRNVCILEPRGEYLGFCSYCTIPLPPEIESIAKYYIGADDTRRHESGTEGALYMQIQGNDGNLVDLDPVLVRVADRLTDRVEGMNEYIGLYQSGNDRTLFVVCPCSTCPPLGAAENREPGSGYLWPLAVLVPEADGQAAGLGS